jgi:hypothetical protein
VSTTSDSAAGGRGPVPSRRRHRGPRRPSAEFYAAALDEADRARLAEAGAVRGIDQEIAVLRVRLARLLHERPDDFALAVRSIELLVRAVGTAGKLSPEQHEDVLERVSAELGGILSLLAEEQEV